MDLSHRLHILLLVPLPSLLPLALSSFTFEFLIILPFSSRSLILHTLDLISTQNWQRVVLQSKGSKAIYKSKATTFTRIIKKLESMILSLTYSKARKNYCCNSSLETSHQCIGTVHKPKTQYNIPGPSRTMCTPINRAGKLHQHS